MKKWQSMKKGLDIRVTAGTKICSAEEKPADGRLSELIEADKGYKL